MNRRELHAWCAQRKRSWELLLIAHGFPEHEADGLAEHICSPVGMAYVPDCHDKWAEMKAHFHRTWKTIKRALTATETKKEPASPEGPAG